MDIKVTKEYKLSVDELGLYADLLIKVIVVPQVAVKYIDIIISITSENGKI
jgi:hypothetical protein